MYRLTTEQKKILNDLYDGEDVDEKEITAKIFNNVLADQRYDVFNKIPLQLFKDGRKLIYRTYNNKIWKYLPKELLFDREFMKEAILHNESKVKFLPNEIANDLEFFLEILKHNAYFQYQEKFQNHLTKENSMELISTNLDLIDKLGSYLSAEQWILVGDLLIKEKHGNCIYRKNIPVNNFSVEQCRKLTKVNPKYYVNMDNERTHDFRTVLNVLNKVNEKEIKETYSYENLSLNAYNKALFALFKLICEKTFNYKDFLKKYKRAINEEIWDCLKECETLKKDFEKINIDIDEITNNYEDYLRELQLSINLKKIDKLSMDKKVVRTKKKI